MSWYENPTVAAIIGAVVGAAITAAASIFIWQKTSRVRRIDCVINDASSLLTFADTIRSKLEVKYAGEHMMRSIPFFGEFVEPFMTVVLAERFERVLRQSK
jgi:hypothetical protein